MNNRIKQKLMIALGWFFVALGVIGAVLPIMPTTVFLIIALWFFSKSSPRFHQMLLNNRWFGEDLRRWQKNKTMSRKSKFKATAVIALTFSVSIALLHGKIFAQIMLASFAVVLLTVIWNIKE